MKNGPTDSTYLLRTGIVIIAAAGFFFFCQSSDSAKASSGGHVAPDKPVATKTTAGQPPAAETTTPAPLQEKLVVYYFHTTMRCPTCHKLENIARSEIEVSFTDALKSGRLVWKAINVEDSGNGHFNDDYKLYTKSIIVSTVKDGRESSWKNLDKIWQLIHDEVKYRQYIREEIRACLDGKCL